MSDSEYGDEVNSYRVAAILNGQDSPASVRYHARRIRKATLSMMSIHSLLREPLLHFLLLGVLLFALFGAVNPDSGMAPDEIVVDQARIAEFTVGFERTWNRRPGPEEMQGLIDNWVREEIFYREGIALGLDRDDPVVRRRIAQKLDFMSDSVVEMPDEAALAAWLADHPDDYRIPPKFAFEQRYFRTDQRRDALDSRISAALEALRRGAPAPGDATLLPDALELTTADQVARVFGERFVSGLAELPVDVWSGPVESGFGVHLVRITRIEPARLPELAEVRPAVERDLIQARTEAAGAAFYEALKTRYRVRIEAGPSVATRIDAD